MTNKKFWLGMLALALIFGMTVVGCGGDDDSTGGGGGGTFTLTDIPAQYNGKYAYLSGYYDETMLIGWISVNWSAGNATLPQISNGSVSIPMWKMISDKKVEKYSGNNSCYIAIEILNSQIYDSNSEDDDVVDGVLYNDVPFSKGSATKSWNTGTPFVPGTYTDVTFSGVTANGSSSQTTTALTLTFSQAITGLSASNITLGGVAGVNKGTLSGSGPSYTLPISGFTAGGSLTVSVAKSGYAISGGSKSVTIYYNNSGNPPVGSSDGLAFTLINGGTAYEVSRGTATATAIVIPSVYEGLPVTAIADAGFGYYTTMTSITIPVGVTSIGWSAFEGCTGLTSVTIPVSVTSIGGGAFCYCSGLTSITIPDSVTSIGSRAFADCTGLTNLTIPVGVASIAYAAFEGCTGLTSVTIPASVTSISILAFSGCSSLTSITIPASVTSIGTWAFSGCTGLTSVTFATGSNIPSYSFGDNVFPQGTGSVGDNLKTAYSTGGAGTYTRAAGGETWTKQ